MKNQILKIGILSTGLCLALSLASFAQTDSTSKKSTISTQNKKGDKSYGTSTSTADSANTKTVVKDKANKKKIKTKTVVPK